MEAGGTAKLSAQNVCLYQSNPPKVKSDLKSDSLFSYGILGKKKKKPKNPIVLINN